MRLSSDVDFDFLQEVYMCVSLTPTCFQRSSGCSRRTLYVVLEQVAIHQLRRSAGAATLMAEMWQKEVVCCQKQHCGPNLYNHSSSAPVWEACPQLMSCTISLGGLLCTLE